MKQASFFHVWYGLNKHLVVSCRASNTLGCRAFILFSVFSKLIGLIGEIVLKKKGRGGGPWGNKDVYFPY